MNRNVVESIKRLVVQNATPGVNYAIISKNEKIIGSYGLKAKYSYDKGILTINEEKNDINTLYDIASLTKVVCTITIILRLVEKNKVNLNDKVSNFLSKFKYKDVTIYDLLTHTSGLITNFKLRDIISYDEILDKIYSLNCEKDKKFIYSDVGYIFLGLIIEKICKKSLDKVFEEEVTIPLDMKSTVFNPKDKNLVAPTEITKKRGVVRGIVHDEKACSMNGVAGHAGVFSNITDLINFCSMILDDGIFRGERYLKKETLDILFNSAVENVLFKRSFSWFVGNNPNVINQKNCISFSGFTGPSISIDREHKIIIILLTNRIHPNRKNNLNRKMRVKISKNIYDNLKIGG